MLRQAVSYAIDDRAKRAADEVGKIVKKEPQKPFDQIVAELQKQHPTVQLLASGWVKKDNKDGGLAMKAASLKKQQVSEVFKSLKGDGYYVVRLVDVNNDGDVSYEFIRVPLTAFDEKVAALKEEGKVHYFIRVPDTQPQVKQAQ